MKTNCKKNLTCERCNQSLEKPLQEFLMKIDKIQEDLNIRSSYMYTLFGTSPRSKINWRAGHFPTKRIIVSADNTLKIIDVLKEYKNLFCHKFFSAVRYRVLYYFLYKPEEIEDDKKYARMRIEKIISDGYK